MWKAIRNLLTRAGESLGVEVPELPDLGAVTDTVTDTVAGAVTDAATGLRETAAGATEQAADTAAGVQTRLRG